MAELPLSVVFHLWLEAAAEAVLSGSVPSLLASKRRLSSLRGFLRRTLRPLGWLAATRRTARDGGGGAVQSVRPSKLPPIFKRRSEGKGERNGGAGGDGGGEMNRSPS